LSNPLSPINVQPLLVDLQSFLEQYINICNLLQTITHSTEEEVAIDCLSVIHSSMNMIHTQIQVNLQLNILLKHRASLSLPCSVISLYTELWHQLFYPHKTEVRRLTHELLIQLENIINTICSIKKNLFKLPIHTSRPSTTEQIIYRPISILDPYILGLQRNYYYPIAPESLNMPDNDEPMENQMEGGQQNHSPKCSMPPTTQVITVESSIEAIADLIKEVEADDPPTEVESPISEVMPEKKVHTHRFAIYRKQTYPTPGAPPNQLALFKSFVKSIKSADPHAKILPIRCDMKIYPLSTTDQVNSLEHIGLGNYFKPYKKTQKTLSGDFHISTKLSFPELTEHPAFNTWLKHNGYNVLYNACQTADMVKVGFLSRVRGFTLRSDLQDYIMASAEWKAAPFHFRLYFDAFTAKGKTAHVLMIDIDRPNLELGIKFFQQWYNGTLTNSPNNLSYMFWPLYKKSYAEEERLKIIADNNYFIGNDSVIGVTGLHPIDNLIKLVNGTYTSIRRLLLSVPTPGTITGHLFVQVERQTANDWLLCCFHQQDSSKVNLRLGTLEDSLRKCVHQESIPHLFTSTAGLMFTNQVAPLVKGRNKLPRMEVPAHTADYVAKSMQKLHTPAAKRQATEMGQTIDQEAQTIQVPRPTPVTYAVATGGTPVTPTAAPSPTIRSESTDMETLQTKTDEHSATLAELRKCCASLAASQQQLSNNMSAMNSDINTKFSELVNANLKINDRFLEMSAAIESLRTSSPNRPTKFYKENHTLSESTYFG